MIVWNASHLMKLLAEYVDWHENHRLHQGLESSTSNDGDGQDDTDGEEKIVSIPVLGGLHHR